MQVCIRSIGLEGSGHGDWSDPHTVHIPGKTAASLLAGTHTSGNGDPSLPTQEAASTRGNAAAGRAYGHATCLSAGVSHRKATSGKMTRDGGGTAAVQHLVSASKLLRHACLQLLSAACKELTCELMQISLHCIVYC